MIYFSYNDFIDCIENGEVDKVIKVEEKIGKYEIKNGKVQDNINKNEIIEILNKKLELKIFLKEFLNFYESKDINNINYCNNIKSTTDKSNNNNLIMKIEHKEIFIFIKVIENIDINISYKILENSVNIIKKWDIKEKAKNKRYPIVIPIVIYTGKEIWKINSNKKYNKINYVKFENNKINFSYNLININDLSVKELTKMQSNVAKRLINIKNTYVNK